MPTLKQEIATLIEGLPTDANVKCRVEMLQEVFTKLNDKSEFTGQWSDLLGVPLDLYLTGEHRAKISQEQSHFTLVTASSGCIVFVDSASSVNVGVKASQLPEGFESTLWQEKEGFINLVDVEGSTIIIPAGKLAQTENIGDSIYLVKRNGKLYIKGNLKTA